MKYTPTPKSALEIWAHISFDGKLPQVIPRESSGEKDAEQDTDYYTFVFVSRFMDNRPARVLIVRQINGCPMRWRNPLKSKHESLEEWGYGWLYNEADEKIPGFIYDAELAQFTDWCRNNPLPTFTKFEKEDVRKAVIPSSNDRKIRLFRRKLKKV